MLLFLCGAGWEWGRLCGLGAVAALLMGAVVGASGLAWLLLPAPPVLGAAWLGLATLLWITAVPAWLFYRDQVPGGPVLAALGWFMLLACWYAVWQARESGAAYLFLLLGVAWIADICAYFAGKAFGRHKLAPAISPGKTWEGVAGGALGVQALMAACVLGAAAVPNYFGELSSLRGPLAAAGAAAALTAVSVVGDLFESLLKRRAGMKDSSALLPGHGGVLDRIDALPPTLPAALALLALARMRT